MTLIRTQIYTLLSFGKIYGLMKVYGKQTLFMIKLCLCLTYSLDLLLQPFLILSNFILKEFVNYSVCFVIQIVLNNSIAYNTKLIKNQKEKTN